MRLYRRSLKNREFGKKAPQNFQATAVRSERPLPGRQGASEHENFEEKPTMPKTDSSSFFGIPPLFALSLLLVCRVAGAEQPQIASILDEKQCEINLKDPVFTHGVIMTEQGGIVTAEGIRIQAQKIAYTNRIENGLQVQRVVAEGDLMMEYGGRAFVGTKLEYDFVTKTGTLWGGKTFVDVWFLGGDKISLQEDGSYLIYDAYVTTSESQENSWEIRTGLVKITRDHLLSANNIRFQFFRTPLFWLPSFKSNLKWLRDPPIRYKVKWDKGLGPRISMRYQVYSWEQLKVFLRFDYRITRGPGGALEAAYHSLDQRTTFLTRNYGAYDKVVVDERGNKRFRLQGLYESKSRDERTRVHLSYDRLSDDKMASDLKQDDFEINTQKRTLLRLDHQEEMSFQTLRVQPRINRFQTLNQELPLGILGIRPFELGPSGIIMENAMSAGYLDYVFDRYLSVPVLANKHAVRVGTTNAIYRPFHFTPFTVTPRAGIAAIYYNNNPEHDPIGQVAFTYGGDVSSQLFGRVGHYTHQLSPYFEYRGISQIRNNVDNHFYFSIDDAYAHLEMMRLGIRNAFINPKRGGFAPTVTADVYTYGYLQSHSTDTFFPKGYLDLGWHRPSYILRGGFAWNFDEQVLDYSNMRADVTINENAAFGLEFRHRSRFDWRKADHENFLVDVTRSLRNLLESPLSDGRNTILAKFRFRLSPRVTWHLESHHGWGRATEPRYNSIKSDLFVMLASSWVFRGSLQYTKEGGLSPTVALNLIK
jgi:hypothetical protein